MQFFTKISGFESCWRASNHFSFWRSCGTTQPSKIIPAKYVWHLGVKKEANMIVTEFTAGSNSNSDSGSSQRCFTVIAARLSNVYSSPIIQPWVKPGYQLAGFNTWMPKRYNFRSDIADLFAEHITCYSQHCLGGGSIRKRSFRTDIRSFSFCSLASFHLLFLCFSRYFSHFF